MIYLLNVALLLHYGPHMAVLVIFRMWFLGDLIFSKTESCFFCSKNYFNCIILRLNIVVQRAVIISF